MKMRHAVVTGLVFMTGMCIAGSGEFYTETGEFLAKYSGACPSGNVVQSILQLDSEAVAPTNVSPYLGPGEMLSPAPQAADTMGTDPLYGWYFGDGELGTMISTGDDNYLHGYVRAFSATTITGAAYYANSPCEEINDSSQPSSDNDIPSDVTVETVNPAYLFPGFAITTSNLTLSDDVDSATVGGNVPTATADNNMLAPADVTIYWTNMTAGMSGSFAPGEGSWLSTEIGVSNPGTTNTVHFYAMGNSPLAGLPRSAEQPIDIIVIPEPAMIAFVSFIVVAGIRRYS